MKRLILLFLVILFLPLQVHGQALPAPGRPIIEEEDGSHSAVPWKLKFSNGTLNNNTDGSVSVAVGGAGTGDLIHSGTPAIHQWGVFTDSTHIKGVGVTASKPACTDSSGEPAVCAGTEGVWQIAGSYGDFKADGSVPLTGYLDFGIISKPAAPTGAKYRLYFKSDTYPYFEDSNAAETKLAKFADIPSLSGYAPLASPTFTGILTMPTGGTGAIPWKMVSGTVANTPVAGAFEFTTDALYFTITSATARKTIAFLDSNISGTAGNLSGTPALPDGTTATTKSQGNSSTALATTAYVDTGLGGKQASNALLTDIAGVTFAKGYTLYYNGTNLVGLVPLGTNAFGLYMSGTIPAWKWVTASKPICSDASGLPVVCAGTEGVWQPVLTNPLVAAGTQALTADWDAGNYTFTGKSFVTKKVSGKYGFITLYASNSTDITGPGFAGPSGTVATNFWLQMPLTISTNYSMFMWGIPAADGDGNLISPLSSLTFNPSTALGSSTTVIPSEGVVSTKLGAYAPLVSPSFTTPALGAATGTSLMATGRVDGTVGTLTSTANSATAIVVATHGNASYFWNIGDSAAHSIFTLPTAAAGLQYCIRNYTGISQVLTFQTSTSGQFIDLDGVLTNTGGKIKSNGAAGDSACVIGVDDTHWAAYHQMGTWTKD